MSERAPPESPPCEDCISLEDCLLTGCAWTRFRREEEHRQRLLKEARAH
jgi:hypothetical protein